jgi:hypothetical protein
VYEHPAELIVASETRVMKITKRSKKRSNRRPVMTLLKTRREEKGREK